MLSKPQLKLIISAEKIIGDMGYEGTSLRQIAQEAGYKNVRAVQYHFKNKSGILNAVIQFRRQEMENERIHLFAKSSLSLSDTPSKQLMKYIIIPPLNQVNEEGRRTYARFYRSIIPQLYTSDRVEDIANFAPFTNSILNELRKRYALSDESAWRMSLRGSAILIFNFIANFEEDGPQLNLSLDQFAEILTEMSLGCLVRGLRPLDELCSS